MARVGIGVLGVGRMGRTHAVAVSRATDTARLAAVADVNMEAARAVAEAAGAGACYGSAEELFHDPAVQGIMIATPSSTHREWVERAAAAGKHILCEKPLALTEADHRAAMAAAARHGVILQVGFMRRFLPDIRAARAAIAEGSIGRPAIYRALQRDESAPPPGFCDPAVSGGILVDMGIHEFDQGRWLTGQEVTEVYAVPGPAVDEGVSAAGDVDNVCVQLRFDGGAAGQVDLSRNARYGDDIRFEVLGSHGAVFWGDLPRRAVTVATAGALRQPTTLSFTELFLPAWTAQAGAFAAAIAAGRSPEVTGEDALAAFRIAVAARESLAAGRPISL